LKARTQHMNTSTFSSGIITFHITQNLIMPKNLPNAHNDHDLTIPQNILYYSQGSWTLLEYSIFKSIHIYNMWTNYYVIRRVVAWTYLNNLWKERNVIKNDIYQTNEDKSEMNAMAQHIGDDKPKYNLKVLRLLN